MDLPGNRDPGDVHGARKVEDANCKKIDDNAVDIASTKMENGQKPRQNMHAVTKEPQLLQTSPSKSKKPDTIKTPQGNQTKNSAKVTVTNRSDRTLPLKGPAKPGTPTKAATKVKADLPHNLNKVKNISKENKKPETERTKPNPALFVDWQKCLGIPKAIQTPIVIQTPNAVQTPGLKRKLPQSEPTDTQPKRPTGNNGAQAVGTNQTGKERDRGRTPHHGQ